MTQNEFVTELEQSLKGNVSERVIRENVKYYSDYISEQKAAGKTEEEIFSSLGSPRLIAKTIIDTAGEDDFSNDSASENKKEESSSGWSFKWIKESSTSDWITKVVAAVVVLAVVLLLLSLIFKIVAILFKPAVVVLACVAIYYVIKNYSKK